MLHPIVCFLMQCPRQPLPSVREREQGIGEPSAECFFRRRKRSALLLLASNAREPDMTHPAFAATFQH